MKRAVLLMLLLAILSVGALADDASVSPTVSTIGIGGTNTSEIDIYYTPGDGLLGGYAFTLNYDPTILAIDGWSLGSSGTYGFTMTGVTNSSGSFEFWAISDKTLAELGLLQTSGTPFLLGLIDVHGIATGTSDLTLTYTSGDIVSADVDSDGFPIVVDPTVTNSSITVTGGSTQVPEPASMLFVGSGLLGLLAWRRKK